MTSTETRLKRLEDTSPEEPVFVGWKGRSWTEEEKSEAVRNNPGQRVFWMPLTRKNPDVQTEPSEAIGGKQ